jgi:hypothetical protein
MSDTQKILSGRELIEQFFENLKEDDSIEQSLRICLYELYSTGKFSEKHITNALLRIREEVLKRDEN